MDSYNTDVQRIEDDFTLQDLGLDNINTAELESDLENEFCLDENILSLSENMSIKDIINNIQTLVSA